MAERRDENFLARWSRRKQAARAAEREQEAQHSAPHGQTPAADANTPERRHTAERTPALPDPATLDASADFSVFLGREVPIETHRAALRRLWRLDPFYNQLDGLSDYCEDFTDQARVVQGLRTAYKVGRGMLEQTGEAVAHPDEAQATQAPGDEPDRIAASSDEPMPPEKPEPGTPPAAEVAPPTAERRGPEPRGPSPLPRRG
jgi:Protein of unknown function (DUF3306)